MAADKQLRQFAESIDRVPLPQDLADEFVEKPTGTQRYFAMAAALFLMLGGFFYLQNTQYEKVHLPALVSGDRVTTQSGYLEVVASFRNKNGGYCREVVSHSSHSVYCMDNGSWQERISVPRADIPDDAYQPAGIGDLSLIDDFVRANIDGTTLSVQDELTLIDADWEAVKFTD